MGTFCDLEGMTELSTQALRSKWAIMHAVACRQLAFGIEVLEPPCRLQNAPKGRRYQLAVSGA